MQPSHLTLWCSLYKATKATSYDVIKVASRSPHLKMHIDLLPQGRSSQVVPQRTCPGPPSWPGAFRDDTQNQNGVSDPGKNNWGR